MTKLKRFVRSPAYIDGSHVSAYVMVGLLVSLAFAVILRSVVNPLWLGVAVMSVFVYQLAMFWLMRQFTDAARVFVVLIFGVINLGLIASLVTYVTRVTLPTDLPIVMYLSWLYPFHTTTYDPASVAIYYASFAHIVGLTVTAPAWIFGENKPIFSKVDIPSFKKADLFVDVYLDRLSFYLDSHRYGWVAVLAGAITAVVAVVVGGAALLL